MSGPVSRLDWYRHDVTYEAVQKTVIPAGSHGTHLARSMQPAGVYNVPAAGVLSIQMPLRSGIDAVFDHGQRSPVTTKAMDLCLSPADVDLCYDVRGDCDFIVAFMPKSFFAMVEPTGRHDFGRLHDSHFSDEMISALLGRLWQIASTGHPIARLFADSAFQTLAIALAARADGARFPDTLSAGLEAKGGLATWQLRRVCDAMEERLDGDIGLADLAAVAGLSPTHFSRAFKQSTGLSPFNWLRERRIERAKELLGDVKVPLAEVALAVGFSAQPEFTTAFRRLTGSTPGAWRRERLL